MAMPIMTPLAAAAARSQSLSDENVIISHNIDALIFIAGDYDGDDYEGCRHRGVIFMTP